MTELRQELYARRLRLEEAHDLNWIGKHWNELRPHLVIVGPALDPSTAAVDGLRHIRRIDSQVPIIFMSPETGEDAVLAAVRSGAQCYLRHPASASELLASIERWLGRASWGAGEGDWPVGGAGPVKASSQCV